MLLFLLSCFAPLILVSRVFWVWGFYGVTRKRAGTGGSRTLVGLGFRASYPGDVLPSNGRLSMLARQRPSHLPNAPRGYHCESFRGHLVLSGGLEVRWSR
jgi:hypothetical protein